MDKLKSTTMVLPKYMVQILLPLEHEDQTYILVSISEPLVSEMVELHGPQPRQLDLRWVTRIQRRQLSHIQ